MLYSIDSDVSIKDIPHRRDYDIWRSRITKQEYDAIFNELNRRIETNEVHTSSWIPGADWSGTVFQPIYEKACRRNVDAAAKFFGLILWEVMMHRPEKWSFGRYEKDGVPIEGLTYFRIQK